MIRILAKLTAGWLGQRRSITVGFVAQGGHRFRLIGREGCARRPGLSILGPAPVLSQRGQDPFEFIADRLARCIERSALDRQPLQIPRWRTAKVREFLCQGLAAHFDVVQRGDRRGRQSALRADALRLLQQLVDMLETVFELAHVLFDQDLDDVEDGTLGR